LQPTPAQDQPFVTGEVLDGKYRIDDLLGEGAMGLVFEAEHLLLDKKVAIKVLRPELTGNEELRRRFEIEARAAAAVSHPNVVTVSDMGRTARGAVYFVMDRLVGETLADRLERMGKLPFWAVVAIAVQILDALEAAHALGLVHRDLKLENVFLAESADGRERVKILDFGVAKVGTSLSGSPSATRTGMLIGTPEFMAPEQARGDREVDARADLYALAVILYRMIAGRSPFSGETAMAMIAAVLTETPPDLGQLRPDLPPAVVRLIMAAMSRDRELRPGSAAEFRARLHAACAEPVPPEDQPVLRSSGDLVPLDHQERSSRDLLPLDHQPSPAPAEPSRSAGGPFARLAPLPDPAPEPPPIEVEERTPTPVLAYARRPQRGQLAPPPEEQRRQRLLARLRKAAFLAVAGAALWAAWLFVLAPTWRAVDQRLRPPPAEEPVAAAPPAQVSIQIEVTPPSAALEVDDQPLDRPQVELLKSPDKHTLRASLPGYAPATIEFVADTPKVVPVHLTRLPRRRSR
jgi:serine/threonine-protein kinase